MKRKNKKICITALGVLLAFIILMKIYHNYRLVQEKRELEEYGVGEIVNVDGKDINVYQIGKQDSQQTIVYIQGLGSGDTVISTRLLFDKLKDDFHIYLIDRAGNGMSSDTKADRTVEEIVEEYRLALKQSSSNKKYILMAHSIGGMYAEYWASLYPDEVEAIIYLDATPAECYVEEGKPKVSTLAIAKAENIFCSTGLQRLLVSKDMLIGKDENDIYTDKEEELRLSLMYRNTYSRATYSEMKLYYDNARKVLNSREIKDILKLYIVANSYNGAYFDNVYKERLNKEYDGDNEKIEEKIEKGKELLTDKLEYIEALGNIDIKYVSGPHTVYEYAPNEIADAVIKFLK